MNMRSISGQLMPELIRSVLRRSGVAAIIASILLAGVVVPVLLYFRTGPGVTWAYCAGLCIGAALMYWQRAGHRPAEDADITEYLDRVPVGIFVASADGEVRFQNEAARRLLRRGERSVADFYRVYRAGTGAVYPPAERPLQRALQGEFVSADDLELDAHGRRIRLHVWASPLYNKDGRCRAAIVTFMDISEQKRSEQRLVELREAADAANHAKSAFLAAMTHELRTPLNAIIGYSGMISEEFDDLEAGEILRDVGRIRIAGKQLLGLVGDVLDLSKIEAGQLEIRVAPFAVRECVDAVVTTVWPRLQSKAIELRVDVDSKLSAMTSDLVRARQCMLNLVGNAAKYTEAGAIEVEARLLQRDEGDWLAFAVSDTGVGIEPEDLDTIFEPFRQVDASLARRYGGAGLGLPITRRLAQLLGGSVSVVSSPGQGSRFELLLPFLPCEGGEAR